MGVWANDLVVVRSRRKSAGRIGRFDDVIGDGGEFGVAGAFVLDVETRAMQRGEFQMGLSGSR
ncbi:hypothetical protein LBMAG52_39360 [Planctomycetia bacterium]|nr:hypothetical protein LBMAG52_39360 [Planctomycetia bacterium]